MPKRGRKKGFQHQNASLTMEIREPARMSDYLPKRLAERFRAFSENEAVQSLRDDIVLVHLRIIELAESLDTDGGAGAIWTKLVEQADIYEKSPSEEDQLIALANILYLIRKGAEDWQKWSEIYKGQEMKKRLVEAESKRVQQQQKYIDIEQAHALVWFVLGQIRAHVQDADVRETIGANIAKVLLGKEQTGTAMNFMNGYDEV